MKIQFGFKRKNKKMDNNIPHATVLENNYKIFKADVMYLVKTNSMLYDQKKSIKNSFRNLKRNGSFTKVT